MIPSFDHTGNLPPGIHSATHEEFVKRFVYNLKRKELYANLIRFIKDIQNTGCTAIYIDGSYVTKKLLPNDIDLCWENRGLDISTVHRQMPELWDQLGLRIKYMMDIFPAHIIEGNSGVLFIDFFQRDKMTGQSKGIVKIEIPQPHDKEPKTSSPNKAGATQA